MTGLLIDGLKYVRRKTRRRAIEYHTSLREADDTVSISLR